MSLRKLLFWAHLAVGVVAGMVILLMSVTGVALTYQRQLLANSARGLQPARVVAPGTRMLPVAELVAAVRIAEGASPRALQLSRDAAIPLAATMAKGRTVYVDGYSGHVLGEASPRLKKFFSSVVGWHRWFGRTGDSRQTARAIFGASNLLFLILVLSGLVLWIPRPFSRGRVAAVATVRRGLSGKARDFNWHNVAGFWFALPLLLVVASGVVISYPWASALVYRTVGEQPPAPRPREGAGERGGRDGREGPPPMLVTAGLDGVLSKAATLDTKWRTITLPLPEAKATSVAVIVDAGSGGQPQLRQTVTIEVATARVLKTDAFATQSTGRKLRSFMRFAHTGEWFGVWGQTIAGLASLAGVLLVWTGLALSWRRLTAWLRRRARSTAATAA